MVEIEDNEDINNDDRKNVGMDGNAISNKHGETSTDTGKKRYTPRDSEEETSEGLAAKEDGTNEVDTEETHVDSGKDNNGFKSVISFYPFILHLVIISRKIFIEQYLVSDFARSSLQTLSYNECNIFFRLLIVQQFSPLH